MDEEKKGEKKEGEKSDNGGVAKGILAGIGAALGIAAIGIGGKLLYDKFNKDKDDDNNTFQRIRREDSDQIIEKLKKQKDLKPKIVNDEFDKNYIRANSMEIENDEEIIKLKNSFICPISQIMMENPVITPYGTTYEYSEILKWIEKNNNDYITKKPLTKDMLVPDYMLKATMDKYNESK